MARLNIYVPDDLAAQAREAGLNVSRLTQEALATALRRSETNTWLARVPTGPTSVTHADALAALDAAREELGD